MHACAHACAHTQRGQCTRARGSSSSSSSSNVAVRGVMRYCCRSRARACMHRCTARTSASCISLMGTPIPACVCVCARVRVCVRVCLCAYACAWACMRGQAPVRRVSVPAGTHLWHWSPCWASGPMNIYRVCTECLASFARSTQRWPCQDSPPHSLCWLAMWAACTLVSGVAGLNLWCWGGAPVLGQEPVCAARQVCTHPLLQAVELAHAQAQAGASSAKPRDKWKSCPRPFACALGIKRHASTDAAAAAAWPPLACPSTPSPSSTTSPASRCT